MIQDIEAISYTTGLLKRGMHEWRLLKLFHKRGLLLPIKDLLRKFIGKETIQCLTNPSAKWQEKLQKTI